MIKDDTWNIWQSIKIIGGSLLFISLPAILVTKYFFMPSRTEKTESYLQKIIQTGPQKEGLKTAFFTEVLNLSADKPILIKDLNLDAAREALLKHPVIEGVQLEILDKEALYIDYTARQPVAWLADFENLAIDKFGYVFPIKPFFPPKKLPSLYIATADFAELSEEGKPFVEWNKPLSGSYIELAFKILEILSLDQLKGSFDVKTIDVSNAFAKSLGAQEIVIEIEESLPIKKDSKQINVVQKRLLRLNAKNYAKGIGNYLKLRESMAQEMIKALQTADVGTFCSKRPIIDLRIEKLGLIRDEKW